jgi:hypothetical protein
VVIAAGAWSGQIEGLPADARVPVRPVKGQILRLRDPAGPGLLRRVVRFEGGYLVPRADGRYVLGATVEERGFEQHPTAGGVHELLRDAHELVPGVSELEIEELCVGLRPGTPDNAPVIGAGALEGLIWATGHHRNGILLAPLTAELVVGLLLRQGRPAARLPPHRFDPRRFARRRSTPRRRRRPLMISLNGQSSDVPRARPSPRARSASASAATRAGSPWRSMARSCRAPRGRPSRSARTRAWRCSRRCREDDRG